MRFLLSLLLLALSLGAQAAPAPLPLEQCAAQIPFGQPTSTRKTIAICRGAYFTLYDTTLKVPLISSYVLHPSHALGCERRDNSFSPDLSVPEPRAMAKDYLLSGYDIGHLVNAADLQYSKEAQAVAAIYTNAAPQNPSFNRGIWRKLENTTRGWAVDRQHSIHVYVGPIFNGALKTIGPNKVGVPVAFFKTLTDLTTGESQLFILANRGAAGDLGKFIVSAAELRKQALTTIPMPQKIQYTSLWPIFKKTSGKSCTL